jgi:hypothetical protein
VKEVSDSSGFRPDGVISSSAWLTERLT